MRSSVVHATNPGVIPLELNQEGSLSAGLEREGREVGREGQGRRKGKGNKGGDREGK